MSRLLILALALGASSAFLIPQHAHARAGVAMFGDPPKVVFDSGSDWKPPSGEMEATDVGDYFPEDYDKDAGPGFTDGMMGSTGAGDISATSAAAPLGAVAFGFGTGLGGGAGGLSISPTVALASAWDRPVAPVNTITMYIVQCSTCSLQY